MQSAGVAGGPRDAARMIDPIHQFNIDKLFTIGHIGNQEIAFTNSSAYMFLSVALISLLMIGGSAGRQLVPGPHAVDRRTELRVRRQHHSKHRRHGRHEVLPAGVLAVHVHLRLEHVGIIPYVFTVSSHIIVTAALALLVFFTVLIYGFYKNGLKFFKLFVPSGIPIVHPAAGGADRDHLVLVASGLAQRASVRQHAGRPHHAEGVRELRRHAGRRSASLGWAGAVLPLALTIALTALELLVAFLQAYVFAILTCIYLNDAIHPGH